jgi:error-prone DNA polymerase
VGAVTVCSPPRTATASPELCVRARGGEDDKAVRLIVGCRLDLVVGISVLVYPTDRAAYCRFCRLLSLGKKRGGKAKCNALGRSAYGEGLMAVYGLIVLKKSAT